MVLDVLHNTEERSWKRFGTFYADYNIHYIKVNSRASSSKNCHYSCKVSTNHGFEPRYL